MLALAVGFFGPAFSGLQGFRVEPAHFVERHGLIVIIAIGESVIAMGLGARNADLGAGVIVAAVLGLAVATSFWLAYFDFFPMRVQQLLAERRGLARISLARDVYSYLHLPMIAGIMLFAFAMEVTLAHVGERARHDSGLRPLRRAGRVPPRVRRVAPTGLPDRSGAGA